MEWIPEDGTGLSDANCYMNADDVRAYALDRGVTLPAIPDGEDAVDPIAKWMILAMDYLAGLNYTLQQSTKTQALDWPRDWSVNTPADDWVLPVQMGRAQAQLVIEQFNGIQLYASTPGFAQGGGFVTMEKVDVLETRYSEKIVPGDPDMPAVRALLRGLTVGSNLTTVRV